MANKPLTGSAPVNVDGIRIDAPGLAGEVVVETGAGEPRRDPGDQIPPQIRRAIGRHKGRPRRTIRIESPKDVEPGADDSLPADDSMPTDDSLPTEAVATTRGAPSRRGGSAGRPASVRVAVPRPRPGRAQVVLSRDEHGILTWHFPKAPTRGDMFAPAGTDLFEIPRTPSPPTRAFGLTKIIQVITFPVAKAAGAVVEFKVREWDREKHPTALRAYGPDRSLTALDDAAWKRLSKGRTLLFIHGTFDTITGAFGRLPDATLQELHKRYGGRVIAFDHPTIADSPIDNAREFLSIVGDRALDVDIVCHSRGGLVTRSIAERPGDLAPLAPNLKVGTAVLVGATSNGTALADVDRWNTMIDRLTTLLSFAPVPVAVDALETVFGLIRAIAIEAAHDLHGLDAMSPKRPFLAELNKKPQLPAGSSYRAIVSDYEPTDPDLKAFFADELKDDVVFKGPNDGMVDIDSIVGKAIPMPFPVTVTLAFDKTEGIEHANYFGQAKSSKAFLDWLKG